MEYDKYRRSSSQDVSLSIATLWNAFVEIQGKCL